MWRLQNGNRMIPFFFYFGKHLWHSWSWPRELFWVTTFHEISPICLSLCALRTMLNNCSYISAFSDMTNTIRKFGTNHTAFLGHHMRKNRKSRALRNLKTSVFFTQHLSAVNANNYPRNRGQLEISALKPKLLGGFNLHTSWLELDVELLFMSANITVWWLLWKEIQISLFE